MENKLCIDRDGNGCIFCKLFNHQTSIRCVKGLWEGKGYVKLSQADYLEDGTISPRPRNMLKIAQNCEQYEEMKEEICQ